MSAGFPALVYLLSLPCRTSVVRMTFSQRQPQSPSLAGAYERVRRNGGCAGTDGQTVWDFAAGLEENLRLLREELLNRAYRPSPLLRVSIEARGGGYRQLSIPAVRDRVAQTAVSMALTPIFEQGFADCSFGYRPGRSVDMAVRRILAHRARGKPLGRGRRHPPFFR